MMPSRTKARRYERYFLSSMDDAISATKEELVGYRELKKGHFQKMFA